MLRNSKLLVVLAGLVFAVLGTKPLKAEESEKVTLDKKIAYFRLDVKKGEPPAGYFEIGTEIEILQKFKGKVAWALVRDVNAPDQKWLTVLPTPSLAVASQDESTVLLPGNSAKLNDLGFRLLRSQADKHENVVVSPYGLWSVLRLLREGAVGDTKQELEELIGTLEDEQVTRFKVPEFRTADCFLRKPDVELTPRFREFALSCGVELREKGVGELERGKLNKWVAEQTNQMIQGSVEESDWQSALEMLFVNANSLRAKWLVPFPKDVREATDFHVDAGKVLEVPMMPRNGVVTWSEFPDLGLKAVALEYESKKLVAVFLVPDQVDGISTVLEEINASTYERILSRLEETIHDGNTPRKLLLPSFQVRKEYEILDELHLAVSKSNDAEFKGISPSHEFKLTGVKQQGYIQVHEEGTEAASRTEAGFGASSIQEPLAVDRPFIMLITHRPSHSVMFATIIRNPVGQSIR